MHEDTISKVSNAAKGKIELLQQSKARYLTKDSKKSPASTSGR